MPISKKRLPERRRDGGLFLLPIVLRRSCGGLDPAGSFRPGKFGSCRWVGGFEFVVKGLQPLSDEVAKPRSDAIVKYQSKLLSGARDLRGVRSILGGPRFGAGP